MVSSQYNRKSEGSKVGKITGTLYNTCVMRRYAQGCALEILETQVRLYTLISNSYFLMPVGCGATLKKHIALVRNPKSFLFLKYPF